MVTLARLVLLFWCCLQETDAWRFDVIAKGRVGFTFEEKVALLRTHNNYRREAGASNMNQLLWNSGLENLAQNWTGKCQWYHNYKRHRIPGFDYRYVGENMYLSLTWMYTTRALDQWHNEKKFLSSQLTCRSRRMCGHYVQMVWYNTETVGCSVRYCKKMGFSRWVRDGFFMVCDYGPLGNTRGVPLFKKGKPCSECPHGRVCVNKLCALPNCNNIKCQNGGQLVQDVCMCNCTSTGYEGETCQTRITG
ncbi:GLIPR1-like protein 1 [Haliotis asinina]|uniref:GLIPR1-like protein 1 n=1 Tax=Haliotis asinina TaxID=109174 RepID=UPI0035319A79